MSGGRAFQIGPAHEGGGPGRGNPPEVEVFRLGNSGTIVLLWYFCISFLDAYTAGLRLEFEELRASDVQSRARAWRTLAGKDAKFDEGRASEIAGLA